MSGAMQKLSDLGMGGLCLLKTEFGYVSPDRSQICDLGEAFQINDLPLFHSAVSDEEDPFRNQNCQTPCIEPDLDLPRIALVDEASEDHFSGCCDTEEFVQHVFNYISENSLVCTLCKKSYRHLRTLKQHVKSHFRKKTVSGSASLFNTKLHRSSRKIPSRKISTCRDAAGSASSLKYPWGEDMMGSSVQKRFPPSVCDKICSRRSSFTRHVLTHKSEAKESFIEDFPVRPETLFHSLGRAGVSRKASAPCKKRFNSCKTSVFQNVESRVNIPSKPKSFPCRICGKEYSTKFSLTRHKSTHFDQTKHVCTVCESSFASKQSLVRHMSVHGTDESFTCNVCQKMFSSAPSLQRHVEKHEV